MERKFSILILFFLLIELNLFAQDTIFTYPSRSKITVTLKVMVEKSNRYYIYNYKMENSTESEQSIEEFYIEYFSEINSIINPSNWIGLKSDNRIPVVIWGSNEDVYDISQGGELEGFSFNSEGIPSLLNFYAAGNVEEPTFDYGEAPPIESTKGLDIFENSKKGKTIAPKSIPEPFNEKAFLDTLINYIPGAQNLNWLGDQNFADELYNHLQQTRSYLAVGDSVEAAGSLGTFVDLVEETNNGQGPPGASLTSEGYALLYFNAKYLLDRLPEPPNPSVIPQLPAALTIVSDQASGAFSADNFLISGGSDANGILTTTEASRQGIINGLQSYQQDNITGTGSAPDVVAGTLDFDPAALIDSVLTHVDQTIPVNASGIFGSQDQPVVLHAEQGIQSSGTISGYGILLVDGPLYVSGTTNWNGLIIQRGRPGVGPATSVSTSLTVNGGMIVYNEGPFGASLQVSNELIIQLSRPAIQNLIDKLSF